MNNQFLSLTGYTYEETIGHTVDELNLIVHPEQTAEIYNLLQTQQANRNYEIELRTKSGQIKTGLLSSELIELDGQIFVISVFKDISARKHAEEALRQSEAKNRALISALPDLIMVVNSDGIYLDFIATTVFKVIGKTGDFIGTRVDESLPEELAQRRMNALRTVLQTGSLQIYEQEIYVDSATQTEEVRVVPYGENEVLILVRDITNRKQAEIALQQAEANLKRANLELEKLVNMDGLTQIANRRCFDDRIQQEWLRLYREQQPLSLLLFDVDYFKCYNDYYGHQLGDECLIKIAQAAQQVVCRPADLVARYGGEEFVVILPNTDREGAIAIAQRIHVAIKALDIPHQASEVSNTVTISLGIASLIPTSERSLAILITQADRALYCAKQQGRNQFVTFS